MFAMWWTGAERGVVLSCCCFLFLHWVCVCVCVCDHRESSTATDIFKEVFQGELTRIVEEKCCFSKLERGHRGFMPRCTGWVSLRYMYIYYTFLHISIHTLYLHSDYKQTRPLQKAEKKGGGVRGNGLRREKKGGRGQGWGWTGERRRANMQNADAFPGPPSPSTAYRHNRTC